MTSASFGWMRTLEDHKVNPANDLLTITVLDTPGQSGACREYSITSGNAAPTLVSFQNGPINEVGVNGVTHEALLAILCDRLRGFQHGPYASPDNAEALKALGCAQVALLRRTRARMARDVEGTHAT